LDFERLHIPDVILCKPKVFYDERGYFYESFRQDDFERFTGKKISFCQDNEAKSTKAVLRGLHYQLPPFAQSKLVRVVKGSVLDIAVDIRTTSKTFGQHVAVELNEKNKYQLFVPKGFAHGYVGLTNEVIFNYKVDNYYHKESEAGIYFNDSNLAIDWKFPTNQLIISGKDKLQPSFEKATYFETNL
jgi:dTDP-4-dehydrorhamnose 3,5-epimerase